MSVFLLQTQCFSGGAQQTPFSCLTCLSVSAGQGDDDPLVGGEEDRRVEEGCQAFLNVAPPATIPKSAEQTKLDVLELTL